MPKRKSIILPHGGRTKLAQQFKTTYVTVYSALTYKTNSSLAKAIRKAALKNGGYEVEVNDR